MRRSVPTTGRAVGVALAAVACSVYAPACGRDRASEVEQPRPAPPRILELSLDAANQPRDGGPLIAGEEVRVGLRILDGSPPYRVSLLAVSATAAAPAIEAATEVGPGDAAAAGVEVAMRATIAPHASSGTYRLEVTATDGAGARSETATEELTVIGSGAALRPAPDVSPFIEITDAGGRRRASFVRGEALGVRARLPLPAPPTITVRIHDPSGEVSGEMVGVAVGPDGTVSLGFAVPRLARAGEHTVALLVGGAPPARASLRVDGPPFPPVDRLVVDSLRIWGGADERAPRRGRLRRGERVVVEARVGGVRDTAHALLRLPNGAATEIGSAHVNAPAPDKRIFLRGAWRVPGTMPAGRTRLELEVTDGDHVSTRYREVLIE